MGNGSLQVGNAHFTFLLLIAFAAAALSRKSLEGPKLAIVIALAQFGTHFFFSTSGNAELMMAISHVVFGVISYQLVVHLDEIFTAVVSAFERLVVVVLHVIKPVVVSVIAVASQRKVYVRSLLAQDIARRGPPVAN